MKIRQLVSKHRIAIIILALIILLLSWVVIVKPFVIQRLAIKTFTHYHLTFLKYPNSNLVEKEIQPTSKITMQTIFTYHTSDNVENVLEYMENKLPGFVLSQAYFIPTQGYETIDPTYENSIRPKDTAFKFIFALFAKYGASIKVYIYPLDNGGTSIVFCENWGSMGFPSWVKMW